MMTIVLVGVMATFAVLFAAMAFAPLVIEDVEQEREIRPATPVSFERRLPQAA